MSKVEREVRALCSGDGEMEDALETVLEYTDDGEVKWVDVRDDLTSGQWGRLIEKEILVDGDAGFRVADPDAVRDGLAESPETEGGDTDTEMPEDSDWSTYDKAAGLATLGFFVGYAYGPVRNVIGTAVDFLLGPVNGVLPFYAVIMVIALFTGVYSTLLRAALMDMDKMSKYQSQMKEIQERRKAAKERGDDEALDRIQEEQMDAMGDQLGMFKEQFRPMVWIMFITIPLFLWMFWKIGARGAEAHLDGQLQSLVVPIAGGPLEWTAGLVGPVQLWIVWYFLCSMAFTQLIQKSLNIQMTPSSS